MAFEQRCFRCGVGQLILKEEKKTYGTGHSCAVCKQHVMGLNYYICKGCYSFFHKSCGELPREMQHPLHPEHTLEITGRYYRKKCHGCCEEWIGDNLYECSHCKFYLDPKCAFLPLTIKAESHDHHLILLRKSFPFTCDTCGKESKCMSYFCITCSFVVHTQCALIPSTLKVTSHDHPLSLNLKYSPQLNQSENQQICQLCVQKVDTKYKVYYCSSCDFAAHPRCAAKIDIRDETFDPELKDDQPIETHLHRHDESTDTLAQIVDKINPGNGKAEIVTEIKHLWHEHHLKLGVELENNEKCDGCARYLSSLQYYCCLQCKFFLHKSCADLPKKKLHPLHKHPLTLQPPNKFQNPYYGPEIFECGACYRYCNGLVYRCNGCNFDLDVPCSLIPTKFTHEGHEHPLFLILSSDNKGQGKCTSCGKYSRRRLIRCADSEFSMDMRCATRPLTTKYGHYEQPFILSYTVEDHNSDGYYCDICGKERDPKHWFYYCEDLQFAAHPDCIMGKLPHMKFGRTYTYDVHEHPLTFVKRTTDHPKCQVCGGTYDPFILVCDKCDHFVLDRFCLWDMMIEKKRHI
ncbi:hypothetical protein I3843_08G157700 [Carya illinoinensis]|nr:hypothetical protein I3843_08G157700 [Carya illinoinensis]